LLNERRRVRFHQPSRVEEAEEVRSLIDQGRLKIQPSLPKPPTWLVNEVGRDLAEILEAARVAGGRVVCSYPIFRLQTFMEIEADLQDYAEVILSTKAFISLLFARGSIDARTHEHAQHFLRIHDHAPNIETDPSLLECRLYLDDLAITYLQTAGGLRSACHCGLDLWVHPSIKEDQSALIEANREGNKLAQTLDDIRVTLLDTLDRGQAMFMPRHHGNDEEPRIGWLYQAAPTLAQMLKDIGPCDAVCIDDRFVNRQGFLTDEAGHTVPIVCVLDLLQHLEIHNVISTEEKHRALHKLRQGGYVLVPVTPDELEMYLRNARLDPEGCVIESAEMRLLRQTLMRVRSLDMVELPTEGSFLGKMQLVCILVIRRLWADEALPSAQVVALSHWVWCNVAPSPLDWARNIQEPLRAEDIPAAFARHFALLLRPMPLQRERYEVFHNWVEREILEPLLPANANLIDSVVGIVRTEIERLSEEWSNDAGGPTC
jgi:hypothetical protein